MTCLHPAVFLLLVVASIAVAPAHAADPAPSRAGNTLTIPGGKPTGKIAGRLTRDQLRACLSQQQGLRDQDAQAARVQSELKAQKEELARKREALEQAGAALDAERAAVDATQAAAVEAFNAKLVQRREQVAQHESAVESYNTKLPTYNEQVEALNTSRAAWVGNCADRTYDEADFFAIQRGK